MSNTPFDSPYCLYSFFLFSQLYNVVIQPNYEYDSLYEDVCREFGKYCDSEFNDDNEPEYECIVNYLKSLKENA